MQVPSGFLLLLFFAGLFGINFSQVATFLKYRCKIINIYCGKNMYRKKTFSLRVFPMKGPAQGDFPFPREHSIEKGKEEDVKSWVLGPDDIFSHFHFPLPSFFFAAAAPFFFCKGFCGDSGPASTSSSSSSFPLGPEMRFYGCTRSSSTSSSRSRREEGEERG